MACLPQPIDPPLRPPFGDRRTGVIHVIDGINTIDFVDFINNIDFIHIIGFINNVDFIIFIDFIDFIYINHVMATLLTPIATPVATFF